MIHYPRIIAHRCGGALAPENSLVGLEIAARLGCRGVEFDVMLSADDVPLLIHDESLDRTTTGSGLVSGMTAKQIRKFDASSKHHMAFGCAAVPTFSEAMARIDSLALWANIEIKPSVGHEAQTGAVVGRWLAAHWNGHGVISSFSQVALLAALHETEAKQINFAYAALFEKLPKDWSSTLAKTGANAVHLSGKQLTSRDADALNTLGVPWACYTINSVAEATRLFSLGCEAVFTDRPDLWSAREMASR
jgi:glycerophosphoryl diester phosphodiesterase